MKKLFDFLKDLQWKYIVGEIILIFVGINLAIWFNDWNVKSKANKEKQIAIAKIKNEIKSNIEELKSAEDSNYLFLEAYQEYKKIYSESIDELITTPQNLQKFTQKYPSFFKVQDSSEVKSGMFQYKGETSVSLEIAQFTEIAWETTRSINISKEFNYNCLYELQSMYKLQQRVQIEMDKAAEALQNREIEQLIHILEFMSQLTPKLASVYQEMHKKIDNCR